MILIYFYALLSVFIVSLISFIGVITIFLSEEKLKKITLPLISLSAGTLLGGSFLHLIPEAVEKSSSNFYIWLWLLNGIIAFFILEKIICWRHCHIPTSKKHPHSFGIMNLVGDALHNFIDGMIIAGSFLVSIPLGITTSIAIITHEIPQEIADFGVLVYSGFTRKKALFFNFLTALTSVLGALITLFIGIKLENFSEFIIPFAAGGFIYIAMTDLIPELKKDSRPIKSLYQLIIILFGIGIMMWIKFMFE